MMEYCPEGDLHTYLQKRHNSIDWDQRRDLLHNIVWILLDVHDKSVVHCDLHSGNVLINRTEDCVISDFGLSKVISETVTTQRGSYGVIPYMAPELFRGQKHTMETDLYAFGMIMWEISAHEPPFNKCDHDIDLIFKICKGMRPTIIPGTPDCWSQLMQKCWDGDPAKRPNSWEISIIVDSWRNKDIVEEFKKADEYCKLHPSQLMNAQHSGAVYKSRFIPSIEYFDDDEWGDVVSLS